MSTLPNAVISKLHPVRWYIGYNGRSDNDGNKLTSLYRVALTSGRRRQSPDPDEIPRRRDRHDPAIPRAGFADYVDTPADWKHTSVLIGLNLASRDKVGTDRQTLKRDYEHVVVAIRSRAPDLQHRCIAFLRRAGSFAPTRRGPDGRPHPVGADDAAGAGLAAEAPLLQERMSSSQYDPQPRLPGQPKPPCAKREVVAAKNR